MAFGSAVSRITGFLRTILLVAALGSTTATSVAYNAANTLPNMVYELLLGGVLSSVLVPSLVRASAVFDGGLAYTQRLLSRMTVALIVAAVAGVLSAPLLALALVPRDLRGLTAFFGALLLPEILFYGLAALTSAVLNVRGHFGSTAWASALNNIAVCAFIGGYWFVPGPRFPTPATMSAPQIVVMGAGTTAGVVTQALFLVLHLRRTGFRWKWRVKLADADRDHSAGLQAAVRGAFVYVLVSQVGVVAVQRAGSYNGHLATFVNADLLFQIPFGVIVVSYLTATMPALSADAMRHDRDGILARYASMRTVALASLLPITAAFLVLGHDLGVTLFGGAAFGRSAATYSGGAQIGAALAACSWSLVPFALVMIQLRIFYALHDLWTPVLVNVAMVATKVALVIAGTHVPALRSEWLNVATSASYVVGAALGHVAVIRRVGRLRTTAAVILRPVLVSAGAGAAALVVVFLVHLVAVPSWRTSATALALGGAAWLAYLWPYRIATLGQMRGT